MKDLSLLEASEREAVIARRAYQKQWRAANKEKVIAIQSRFWLKKARELQEGGGKTRKSKTAPSAPTLEAEKAKTTKSKCCLKLNQYFKATPHKALANQ